MTAKKQMKGSVVEKVDELHKHGYCILKDHFAHSLIDNCRLDFLPTLDAYLSHNGNIPNRGPNRHFVPMPFERSCFAPEFFFDAAILEILKNVMGDRIVADQWGCDVPLPGSDYQTVHVDYQRPLFYEMPDLHLPAYMMIVSFGLTKITEENGAIELAPGTHKMLKEEALHAVGNSKIKMLPINMNVGDVLIRHPWTLHRGTPNKTSTPRLLVSIRYVRNWYYDSSREVNSIPAILWRSLSPEQKSLLRFPVNSECKT
jgi:ectoine hydroxylase-related dioxygenase (phytanoyl-CoA dioxygenase family)